ncbi:MAG: MFS transporter [Gammaproteobacteria bacterium]|nr:MFS transporter [Gammaproteobacteria bacterium]MCP5202117.1 MFS transporter [Gammaproteobacteria bacterium]
MKTAALDSGYAWCRLAACLLLATVGSAGMFVVVVALPAFQLDFGLTRAGASVPYTMVMAGFGIGGLLAGRAVDRYGVVMPLAVSAILLALAYVQAATSHSVLLFNLAHVQIGCFGCAVVFAPLVADISKWFTRRRGLAVAIAACGNYVGGAIWPPLLVDMLAESGWRAAYMTIAGVSVTVMLPTLLVLLRRPEGDDAIRGDGGSAGSPALLGLTPNGLLGLLALAGFGCCMAMAMPQVHIVSLCGDLGFGPARGAQMLAVMLACGIASRLAFGFVSDRLGGLRTILISSALQGVALVLFLPAQSLTALYGAAALFGLFQGGIVPCYALIVREYFPAAQAGSRLSVVILATISGMALGGWTSGAIFDWTGSYTVAFVHGIGWNLVNLSVILFLLSRARGAGSGLAAPATP